MAAVVHHVVRLQRHRRAELPLQSNRRLIAVGDFEPGRRNLRDALPEAGNPQGFLVGRLRPAVPRVPGEVGAAVICHLRIGFPAAVSFGPRRDLVRDIREVLSGPAAKHGAIVQAVSEADARTESIFLNGTSRSDPRQNPHPFRKLPLADVVAQSKIEREARRRRPVVLHPPCGYFLRRLLLVAGRRDAHRVRPEERR